MKNATYAGHDVLGREVWLKNDRKYYKIVKGSYNGLLKYKPVGSIMLV